MKLDGQDQPLAPVFTRVLFLTTLQINFFPSPFWLLLIIFNTLSLLFFVPMGIMIKSFSEQIYPYREHFQQSMCRVSLFPRFHIIARASLTVRNLARVQWHHLVHHICGFAALSTLYRSHLEISMPFEEVRLQDRQRIRIAVRIFYRSIHDRHLDRRVRVLLAAWLTLGKCSGIRMVCQ